MSQEEKTINLNLSHFFLPIILNTSLKLKITFLEKRKTYEKLTLLPFLIEIPFNHNFFLVLKLGF